MNRPKRDFMLMLLISIPIGIGVVWAERQREADTARQVCAEMLAERETKKERLRELGRESSWSASEQLLGRSER